MYQQVLRQMQRAASAEKVLFRIHALKELARDRLSLDDAIHCILTGEIVEDQYDPAYQQLKYTVYGDTLANEDMCVVARWDDYHNVVVITAYRLERDDYE